MSGCARCKSNDVDTIHDDPAKSDATIDAGQDAAAAIPAEWQGTYAIAVVGDADASTPVEIRRFAVGASGPGAMAKIVTWNDPVQTMNVSPDGATLVFTSTLSSGSLSHDQVMAAVPFAGGASKEIARCTYECGVMGVGVDGEVWYVNRDTGSLIGEVRHVPIAGGVSVAWPNAFSDCYLLGATSDDGTALLLGVDNSLGWPECIALARQGFFVVPIADASKRDRLPKRIDCFTTHKATDINIQIGGLAFEGSDRIRFAVSDGWDADGAPSDAPNTWSCKRDGTDPQRVKDAKPALAVVTEADAGSKGRAWLVVSTGESTETADLDHALHRIVAVDGTIEAWAFRKR
jgi:hypothetical protein